MIFFLFGQAGWKSVAATQLKVAFYNFVSSGGLIVLYCPCCSKTGFAQKGLPGTLLLSLSLLCKNGYSLPLVDLLWLN